jgi:ribulose-phosphate 3-epimerase
VKSAASLWSADLVNLESDIKRTEAHVDAYHLDVSDGRFSPTFLFFPDLVAATRRATGLPLEIHLLTYEPEQWVEPFAEAGANTIIFSNEVTSDTSTTIKKIKAANCRAGLCLNVDADVASIESYLPDIDLVVVMGTKLGIKGVTELSPATLTNIQALCEVRRSRCLQFEVEADGAIRRNTVGPLRQAGADIVVPGSLLFGGNISDVAAWIRGM